MLRTTQAPALLIVEDDIRTAEALRRGLEGEGLRVTIATDGKAGIELTLAQTFDCIVLDWMLPGADGIQILSTLRQNGLHTPVLLLTARDEVRDRVRGLDAGADDYLVKPFAFSELLARLRALLRRTSEPPVLHIADLHIDQTTRQVQRGTRRIHLSPREFDLLVYLARHRGQAVSRPMLARDVWHETRRVTPLDNVIDVHIAHLRKKVDADFPVKLLHTIRGVGFVLHGDAHAV